MTEGESYALMFCVFGLPFLAFLAYATWCLLEQPMRAWAERIENRPHVRPGIEDDVAQLQAAHDGLEEDHEALAVRVQRLEDRAGGAS